MLKVTQAGENNFWVYNPFGGRGRWCKLNKDGTAEDTEHGMLPQRSPETYQKAIKSFLSLT